MIACCFYSMPKPVGLYRPISERSIAQHYNLALFYLINHTVWLYWPISYYIMQGITSNKWQMIEIWYFEWPETLYNIIRFLWPVFLHQAFTDHPTTSVTFLFIGWTLSTALGKKTSFPVLLPVESKHLLSSLFFIYFYLFTYCTEWH